MTSEPRREYKLGKVFRRWLDEVNDLQNDELREVHRLTRMTVLKCSRIRCPGMWLSWESKKIAYNFFFGGISCKNLLRRPKRNVRITFR
jgi:hypothetical protein